MILQCFANLGDEGEREYDKALIFEDIRQDRFKETLEFFENFNTLTA